MTDELIIKEYKENGMNHILANYDISRFLVRKCLRENKVNPNICKCGCGKSTTTSFTDKLNGHNGDVTKMHTPEVRLKAKTSIIERYKNEDRIISGKIYDIPSKEDLYFLHHEKMFSLTQIAKLMSTSIPTIKGWFIKYDVKWRGISESLKNEYNKGLKSTYHDPKFQKKLRQQSGERGKSKGETEIIEFIKEFYQGEILQTYFVENLEIDIFIPDIKIGIEFNGAYWHTEKYKPIDIHKRKTDICNNNGIRLLHIWDDEWNNKKDIIKNKLKYLIGGPTRRIFARKCLANIIDSQIARDFCEQNHIQGGVHNSISIGLFHENELVSAACFTKRKDEYELVRFCSSCSVIGGFSKLVKYFSTSCNFKGKLYSFADLQVVNPFDNVYKNNKWEEEYRLAIDYKYLFDGKRKHKFGFRHNTLNKILLSYNPELTEHQNCINNELYRIYDSGKIKYSISLNV